LEVKDLRNLRLGKCVISETIPDERFMQRVQLFPKFPVNVRFVFPIPTMDIL